MVVGLEGRGRVVGMYEGKRSTRDVRGTGHGVGSDLWFVFVCGV